MVDELQDAVIRGYTEDTLEALRELRRYDPEQLEELIGRVYSQGLHFKIVETIIAGLGALNTIGRGGGYQEIEKGLIELIPEEQRKARGLSKNCESERAY